ncbi:MAG: LamG domain-containing protein, partial [Candidatus Micrarchaeia archaeon]
RPNGPGTTQFINLEGICNGELPQYVAQFNGQNSYINISNPSNLQFGSDTTITISAWINVNQCFGNGASGGAILSHGLDSYAFYVSPVSGPCNLEWAESKVANIGTGPLIPEKQWINVVAVNKIGSNTTLYVDGTKYGPYSFTNTYSYTQDLRIGSSQPDLNGFIFNGSIANVQIYNSSLSANEIQALYQEGIGGAPIDLQHLVAWYPLNGNANDYSGNGNNGKSNSGVTFTSFWENGYTPP